MSVAPFFVQTSPLKLSPNKSVTVNILFKPTQTGRHAQTLSLCYRSRFISVDLFGNGGMIGLSSGRVNIILFTWVGWGRHGVGISHIHLLSCFACM